MPTIFTICVIVIYTTSAYVRKTYHSKESDISFSLKNDTSFKEFFNLERNFIRWKHESIEIHKSTNSGKYTHKYERIQGFSVFKIFSSYYVLFTGFLWNSLVIFFCLHAYANSPEVFPIVLFSSENFHLFPLCTVSTSLWNSHIWSFIKTIF